MNRRHMTDDHHGRMAGWRPESGVKGTGAVRFMVMLGDGSDIRRAA